MDYLDQQLVAAYTSMGPSLDRIACFFPLRQQMFARLPPDLQSTDHDTLMWRLFQLRKAGKLVAKTRE
jgi:hypothetical protein